MSNISIDDDIRAGLESNARRRGLSLDDYLRLVAESDAGEAQGHDQRQAELRRRLHDRVEAAARVNPRPAELAGGRTAEFAAALIKKFRPAG
jgi:hypothetical protein